MTEPSPSIITIDGPSGSGKGTIAQKVATALGWHLLDSGALYRLLACKALKENVDLSNEATLESLAKAMDVKFLGSGILLDGVDVSREIRAEAVGKTASKIASLKGVRAGLLERQRAFKQPPGLVADGRDMGTVIFPEADVKIYLTASVKARAGRRFQQLKEQGFDVSLAQLEKELMARDEQDMNRPIAPLRPAESAFIIDSTDLSIEEVFQRVIYRLSE